MTRKFTTAVALATASLLETGIARACQFASLCQVGQPDREPLRITTSDDAADYYAYHRYQMLKRRLAARRAWNQGGGYGGRF
jgi:hypothetical protein